MGTTLLLFVNCSFCHVFTVTPRSRNQNETRIRPHSVHVPHQVPGPVRVASSWIQLSGSRASVGPASHSFICRGNRVTQMSTDPENLNKVQGTPATTHHPRGRSSRTEPKIQRGSRSGVEFKLLLRQTPGLCGGIASGKT